MNAYKLFELLEMFKKDLACVRLYSSNTIQAYERDIKKLFSYMLEKNIEKPKDLLQSHYIEFVKIIKKRLQDSSIQRLVSAIRCFYKFLYNENEISRESWKIIERQGLPKVWRKVPVMLSQEEMGSLLDSIDTRHKSGYILKMIMEMLYGSGVRVSELCDLKVGCIHLKERYIFVKHGKGGKDRTTPIGKRHVAMLQDYWHKYRGHVEHDDFAIVNLRGHKLDRTGVFRLIKRFIAKNGLGKKISSVTFRHCFATHLLENGAPIRVIQEMLGHENIKDTERYLNLSMDYVKRRFSKVTDKIYR